ncbi:histidine phosphatase family protein [Niallia sp.]|uniref:histidine phosphatase family protein n=1 Tax=Niallia sp. TaxID=2837523 RepID=UPI0028978A84|nr:histidine phosphatase family protein [Niallia sp.]
MNNRKTIYLIRHCEAEGQNADAELTANGRKQAVELADFLTDKEIQFILSSTYLRAYDSIKPLAERLHLSVHKEERLIERKLSDKKLDDWLFLLEKTFTNLDIVYEGGESSRQAMERGVAVVKECLLRKETTFAIVTHGNLLSLMWKYFDQAVGFKEWRDLSNPDVFQMNFELDKIIVNRLWRDKT